ncbi:unnamed protein product, partial [Chrysoparadoxa australica]
VFSRISVCDRVLATQFAGPEQTYAARIINVDSRIDPTSRTFTVRAEVDNQADALRPGMSFRIGFELLSNTRPVVPEAAISWGSDGAFVWLVREGRAEREAVTLVQRRQGRVLVSGDISAGELVVAEGVQRMREGAAVDLLDIRRRSDTDTRATAGATSVSDSGLAQ